LGQHLHCSSILIVRAIREVGRKREMTMDREYVTARHGNQPRQARLGLQATKSDEPSGSVILRYAPAPVYAARVRQVLRLAEAEAQQVAQACVEVDHVLLALSRSGITAASLVLSRLDISLSQLCPVPTLPSSDPSVRADQSCQISAGLQNALAAAAEHAQRLGYPCVGTEHLLIGLLTERQRRGKDDTLGHLVKRLLREIERRTPPADGAVAWPPYADNYEIFHFSVMT
jgi:hypothetical protein